MAVNWDYFDKFESVIDKYMPIKGEGETKASQIVTAVNKLIYKYYNDGDVFDNTHHLKGWANDLSDYANWLLNNADAEILYKIAYCYHDDDYEDLLKKLADKLLDENYLIEQNELEKVGTIYDCNGKFEFNEDFEEEYY